MDQADAPEGSSDQRLLLEFIAQLLSDRETGTVRPVEDYLRQFPGDPEVIRSEYEALTVERTQPLPATHAGPAQEFIGPYRVLSELGRGGQGCVYLAEDPRLGRRVALKVLTGFGALSGPTLARFRRESAVAARLSHRGICAVYETGVDAGLPYLVMQYVEGQTLAEELSTAQAVCSTMVEWMSSSAGTSDAPLDEPGDADDGPTSPAPSQVRAIARFMEEAARAAHVAHEAGFVHRDIKPGNIMVTPDGDPVLLDFGLVRSEESEFPTLTQTGDVLGTPSYMAPEQLSGGVSRVDRRTDVWALGATLYHCLTLQRPFQGPTREALYRQILEVDPPDPRTHNRDVPRDLAVIIATSMDKDRDRRYQTALELAEDLRRFRNREPIHARAAGPWLRGVRWCQRNPVAVLLILSLVAGAAVSVSLALRARSHLRDWERLADGQRLSELVAIADVDLWPARPARVEAMDRWLGEAGELRGRLPEHREALEALRQRALPWTAREREQDRAAHETGRSRQQDIDQRLAYLQSQVQGISGEIATLRDRRAALDPEATTTRDQERSESMATRITDLEARRDGLAEEARSLGEERDRLEERASVRLTWTFEDPRDQIRHDGLRDLVEGLEALAGEGSTMSPPTVAGVNARRAFAERLSESGQDREKAWEDAAQRVDANGVYDGFSLQPVVGLVPIGPDPESGLEEFAHLQSGAVPAREPVGRRLRITEQTGLVFVLLRGGPFSMGAQSGDGSKERFDPAAKRNEEPVHVVTLAPFLMSKFELTQGQWERFTGSNPSVYHPDLEPFPSYDVTLRHPVEKVDWPTAVDVLRRMGLRLPTESQWEYACRGGTDTAWWPGQEREALRGAVNLADQAAARVGAPWSAIKDWPELDDGFPLHAPVGSLRANGFGLHDVHGNVWEWCQDGYVPYDQHPPRPGDGLRVGGPARERVARGAGFKNGARSSRSAGRLIAAQTTRDEGVGLRPVQPLRDG